ncbi:MAG: class I SAM-dependent methyltransferase [Bacteroidetes bacterium]|nr:MAG: class I SAM-dependent methyltransferase [Bacteroidota bacterium]
MKDNFSRQAAEYARHRPFYPPAMVAYLAGLVPCRQLAWDCATGNGQIACQLAEHFEQVLATDISENQLRHAVLHPRVQYKQEPAEHCSAPDQSVDLIVVAQAVHWFDFDCFFGEVHRVLRPGGVVALIGYSLFGTGDPGVDKVIRYFYSEITGPFWDKERRHIDTAFRTIPFPFAEIDIPDFSMDFEWTVEDVLGYFQTWSAVQHYRQAKSEEPVALVEPLLREVWGDAETRPVRFPLIYKVGRAEERAAHTKAERL